MSIAEQFAKRWQSAVQNAALSYKQPVQKFTPDDPNQDPYTQAQKYNYKGLRPTEESEEMSTDPYQEYLKYNSHRPVVEQPVAPIGVDYRNQLQSQIDKTDGALRSSFINIDKNEFKVNDWFQGNRQYWQNQAKNIYGKASNEQKALIDTNSDGTFSLEEIRDYQTKNGLVADGKLGNNTMAHLRGMQASQPSSIEEVQSSNSPVNTPVTPQKFAIKNKDWHNAMTQAGGKVISVGNGDYGFLLNGNVYYNNGRMKGADGKMSNYDYNVPDYHKLNFQGNEYRTENHLKADFNKSFEKYLLGKGENLTKYSSVYGPGLDYYKLAKHPEYQKYYQAALKNNKIINYADLAANAVKNAADELNTAVGNSTNYNPHRRQGFSNGGSLNKYQQGGTMNNEQELQKAFMAFLIEDAAKQGVQIQSEEDLVKYAEALGEDGIKAKYQEFMQKMQGGIKAKLGAKLNYARKIKGLCPEGEELVYMKQGGSACPVCQKKKGGEVKKKKMNAVEAFKAKCGKKLKG